MKLEFIFRGNTKKMHFYFTQSIILKGHGNGKSLWPRARYYSKYKKAVVQTWCLAWYCSEIVKANLLTEGIYRPLYHGKLISNRTLFLSAILWAGFWSVCIFPKNPALISQIALWIRQFWCGSYYITNITGSPGCAMRKFLKQKFRIFRELR